MKYLKIITAVGLILSGSILLTAQNVNIDIDAQKVYQTMDGFGTSLRVFNDPHIIGGTTSDPITTGLVISTTEEDTLLDLLYDRLGLTRIRPATGEDGAIENPNDNNDPDSTDFSKFDFTWKRMDAHIDYVSRALPRGVNTYFPSTIKLEDWMTASNPEEYAEWAFAIIKRWKDQGYELPYYSIMNEPGYSRGGIWSGSYIRDCIKILGPKLDAAGINTKIVVPDDLNANEAFTRSQVIMADSAARKYVGALAYHLYGGNSTNKTAMMQLGQQYNVPVWMTEYSRSNAFTWANDIHDEIANYGVSAVDNMWGFFGQQSNGAQLISLNYTGTNYSGYTIEKQYYVTGQYSRYVKPGAQRIEATSSNSNVKATAFIDGANMTVVVINNHSNTQAVNFTTMGFNFLNDLQVVHTSQTENWAVQPSITAVNDSFTATLAPNSITTFTTALPGLGLSNYLADNGSRPTIYPNPTSDEITVDGLEGGNDIRLVTVLNTSGQVLLKAKSQSNINVSTLPKGVYFLRLDTEGRSFTYKFLKN